MILQVIRWQVNRALFFGATVVVVLRHICHALRSLQHFYGFKVRLKSHVVESSNADLHYLSATITASTTTNGHLYMCAITHGMVWQYDVTHNKHSRRSSVLDQATTQAQMLAPDEHELMLEYHAQVTGGEPLREAEQSAEHLAALKLRVVDAGGERHADFALCVSAENRKRGEHFGRLMRHMAKAERKGKKYFDTSFGPLSPWMM